MTRDEARRRLEKVTGTTRVRLEVRETISSPERRASAEDEYRRVGSEIEAIEAESNRIIREHPELQRLSARRRELRPLRERLNQERHYRKFEGMKTSGGMGWIVLGCGDTWEEVLEQAVAHEVREKAERAEWAKKRSA